MYQLTSACLNNIIINKDADYVNSAYDTVLVWIYGINIWYVYCMIKDLVCGMDLVCHTDFPWLLAYT